MTFFILALPLTGRCQANLEKGVRFDREHTWAQLKEMARAKNSYIFVDLFTTWCGPCKRMDKEVYVSDTVGKYVNDNFIAVKVQIDSTSSDDDYVKSWYADAKSIDAQYKLTAYPSFLFLSPEGNLVYRDLGYRDAAAFLQLLSNATNPQSLVYFNQLNAYKNGLLENPGDKRLALYAQSIGEDKLAQDIARQFIQNTGNLGLLTESNILFVANVAHNRPLADSLAEAYKAGYLDRLDTNALFKANHFEFMNNFPRLIRSNDKIFYLCYYRSAKVDSFVKSAGYGRLISYIVIEEEELRQKLLCNGQPVETNPDWHSLRETIQKKYALVNADSMVMDYAMEYYKALQQYPAYCRTLIERERRFGPFGVLPAVDFDLNNMAWELFLHSDDRKQLQLALSWSQKAVHIGKTKGNKGIWANWMDTEANLQYKLGNTSHAMAIEKEAVALDPGEQDFQVNLSKMKRGAPTWLQ